jgi:hypothetical protein
MDKKLTEIESIAIDNALKDFLDLHKKDSVFKKVLPFFLKKNGIDENRLDFIIKELSVLNILEYKYDNGKKSLGHNFNRSEIIELLKNGGMSEKWLEKESKRVNIKLINKTLKDYFWTKLISWFSFGIAVILAILELIQ